MTLNGVMCRRKGDLPPLFLKLGYFWEFDKIERGNEDVGSSCVRAREQRKVSPKVSPSVLLLFRMFAKDL